MKASWSARDTHTGAQGVTYTIHNIEYTTDNDCDSYSIYFFFVLYHASSYRNRF